MTNPTQPPTWQQPTQYQQQPGPYAQPYMAQPPAKVKKKRRIFLWVFLAIQVLFVVWIATGASTASGTPADCLNDAVLTAEQCNTASDVGTSLGVAIIVILWVVIDVLLGIGYGVYRLAKRP